MTEERKHEIEDIIDNALTEEDCKTWAEGNLTEHVKQLMKEHNIKQLNIWDDVSEIVEFDSQEKTYKYKAYFEGKDFPVAHGTIDAESKEEAEKILFGMCGSWQDENGNVFNAGCPVDVEIVDERKQLTQEEKEIIADGHGLNINQIPDSLETTTKEEWASDMASFWEINHEEALERLNNGEGYSSVSLPTGGMVAVETNGDHLFFVSDMES